ncbi:MAG: helix-turn-helix domain-containing protein [Burkholderiales bacterium]
MSRRSLNTESLPIPIRQAVKDLGENISMARRRRRQTQADLAARMMVSLPTVRRVENGDPSVSIAIYYSALWALGLLNDVRGIAKPDEDKSAQLLDLERLPERVRHARSL